MYGALSAPSRSTAGCRNLIAARLCGNFVRTTNEQSYVKFEQLVDMKASMNYSVQAPKRINEYQVLVLRYENEIFLKNIPFRCSLESSKYIVQATVY